MFKKKMVYLRFEDVQNVNFYNKTITVKIEDYPYTFNEKVCDINNSLVILEGKETPISQLQRIPTNNKVHGFLKVDESIVVNSGLYHLVRG